MKEFKLPGSASLGKNKAVNPLGMAMISPLVSLQNPLLQMLALKNDLVKQVGCIPTPIVLISIFKFHSEVF